MTDEKPSELADLRLQVERLAEQVTTNRGDIDELQVRESAAKARQDASDQRQDASDQRQDASDQRQDTSDRRQDASEARAAAESLRIDDLESRADIDQQMIAELQADGLVMREHAGHLEEALHSSRKIGAAMGVLMATRRVTEVEAFEILRKASQQTNRKVRALADEVVLTGDVSTLPNL